MARSDVRDIPPANPRHQFSTSSMRRRRLPEIPRICISGDTERPQAHRTTSQPPDYSMQHHTPNNDYRRYSQPSRRMRDGEETTYHPMARCHSCQEEPEIPRKDPRNRSQSSYTLASQLSLPPVGECSIWDHDDPDIPPLPPKGPNHQLKSETVIAKYIDQEEDPHLRKISVPVFPTQYGDRNSLCPDESDCYQLRRHSQPELERQRLNGHAKVALPATPNNHHYHHNGAGGKHWQKGDAPLPGDEACHWELSSGVAIAEHQKLVNRLQNMKRRAVGDGTTQCVLCGADFGRFVCGPAAAKCSDCKKSVCKRTCGVEVADSYNRTVFLCNICTEEREIWKKTGAWFYHGVPQAVHSARNSPSPMSPQQRQRQTRSCSAYSSHQPSPSGSGQSSPRRRLPEPPIFSPSRNDDPYCRPASSVPSACYYRPQWAEEAESKQMTKSVDSDSPSEDEPRISKKFSTSAKYKPDSDGESDADHSESAELSQSDSVDPLEITEGREPSPVDTLGDPATTDVSDSYSVDSGVVQSDRSGANITSKSLSVLSGSSSGQVMPTDLIPEDDTEDILLSSTVHNNCQNETSEKTDRVSSDFPKLGAVFIGSDDEIADCSTPVISPKTAASVSALSPSKRQTLFGSKSLEGNKKKRAVPAGLSFSQESGVDHLSSSSDDDDSKSVPKAKPSLADFRLESYAYMNAQDKRRFKFLPSSLGTLEFSLLYDGTQQTLKVHIIKAQNLRSMDPNGFSDPYVKLHVLPGARKSTQLRTKTIPKTLNPEWDEVLTYHGIDENEVLKKTLRLTVLDEDTFGHDFLGETRVDLKRLSSGRERKFNVYLEKQFPMGKADIDAQARGKILISLLYVSSKSQLIIGVIRCAELIGMDASGYSDPYVKVHLKPDKKLKAKTPVKKRTCNPEFNCEFNFPCALTDLVSKKKLEITVFDKDLGKQDDYIGGILLCGSAKGEGYRHWTTCLKSPDQRIERWHKLSAERFD